MDINYSIIIPHKNIPDLLQRCLDSIPVRDDVQVIVVDDNSNPAKVDFANFPGVGRPNTEVYFTKEGKGAGYARNIGLDHAKGKWLLFLDSDDFLSRDARIILDENVDSPYDLVICDNRAVMSDDITQQSTRDSNVHEMIQQYLHGICSDSVLRYCYHPLWGKVIRHSVVKEHNLRFDETKWSNDEFFSCTVGYFSKSINVVNQTLYIVTERSGSLTSYYCSTSQEFSVRLNEAIKSESFLTKRGINPVKFQSRYIISRYYQEKGKSIFLITLISQRFLSKNQIKLIAFVINKAKRKLLNRFCF